MRASVLCILIALPVNAVALTPPLGLEELERAANTIITGRVRNIVETGRVEESNCWHRVEKVAWVKVYEYLKDSGSTDKEINIYFWDTRFKDGCVGSADHVHTVGEEATFYLSCKYVTECRLVHWNGAQPLPGTSDKNGNF